MIDSYLHVCRDKDGNIWMEDDYSVVSLTEWVNVDEIEYDEHEGYILPDGRNLNDIIT